VSRCRAGRTSVVRATVRAAGRQDNVVGEMSKPGGQRQGGVYDVLTEPRSRDSSELTGTRSGSVSSVEEVRGVAVDGTRRRQLTSASVVDVVS